MDIERAKYVNQVLDASAELEFARAQLEEYDNKKFAERVKAVVDGWTRGYVGRFEFFQDPMFYVLKRHLRHSFPECAIEITQNMIRVNGIGVRVS